MTHKILGETLHFIAVIAVALVFLAKVAPFIEERYDPSGFYVLFAAVIAILAYYWNYTRARA